MINSYKKGSNYERKIAKILSDAFGIEFYRHPMSGGFSTIHKLQHTDHRGDIFTENDKFNRKYNVVIECKKVNKPVTIEGVYKANKGIGEGRYFKWIEQLIVESKGKNGWLIFSWDRSNNYITIKTREAEGLNKPVISISKYPLILDDFLKEQLKEQID